MITNVRIGNDIRLMWQILDGGVPVNLMNATDIKVSIAQGGTPSCNKIEITTFEVTDAVNGMISVEVQKEVITKIGYLWAVLEYTVPDSSMIDGNRKVTTDNLPVKIVGLTDEASQDSEFTVSSDIQAGFQGLSAFEVWLTQNPDKTEEDYYAWLQKPATDAVSLIDDKIEHLDEVIDSSTENESERVTAENTRKTAEATRISAETERKANEVERLANESSRASDELIREANESSRKQDEATRKTNENERETAETIRVSNENNRVTAEQERVQAESLRATAESSRELAESLRVEAELLRQSSTQEAISNAENATESANTAAQNADDAREAIQSDLALKADQADLVQLAGDTSVKMTNLITNGNFRNGTSGWSLWGNASLQTPLWAIENNRVVFRDLSSGANGRFEQDILCDIGDKFYIAIDKEGEGSLELMMFDYNSSSNVIFITGSLSSIVTTIDRKNYRLSIGYDEETNFNNFSFSEVRAINLTATFGAGNEPTKEEFELLLDFLGIDYFEGEITIPAQKIMQWQLKLIRKNKNAIIALGGIII